MWVVVGPLKMEKERERENEKCGEGGQQHTNSRIMLVLLSLKESVVEDALLDKRGTNVNENIGGDGLDIGGIWWWG